MRFGELFERLAVHARLHDQGLKLSALDAQFGGALVIIPDFY